MPEYLAPGVFVEEVSFRSKSIEGVSTTTTGFIGPTRYGPLAGEPLVITSMVEYERLYGDGQQLVFSDGAGGTLPPAHNYMWHAAQAFFQHGGKRLYVQRVFAPGGTRTAADASARAEIVDRVAGATPADPPVAGRRHVRIRARHPGDAGRRTVRITLAAGANAAFFESGLNRLRGIRHLDVVRVFEVSPSSTGHRTEEYWALAIAGVATDGSLTWSFQKAGGELVPYSRFVFGAPASVGRPSVRPVTATVTVLPAGPSGEPHIRGGLALDPRHRLGQRPDSIVAMFPDNADLNRDEADAPVAITVTHDTATVTPSGLDVLAALLHESTPPNPSRPVDGSALGAALLAADATERDRSVDRLLQNGDDGVRPGPGAYEGTNPGPTQLGVDDRSRHLLGWGGLESVEEISIVAAPGSTAEGGREAWSSQAFAITQQLIRHAERMRYRIAVLDPPNGQSVAQVQQWKARLDSRHAALYYPWIRAFDPITQLQVHLPPSGYVAGIYARNDVERAVYKAPANEVVSGAEGFELLVSTGQQEVLNPLGVNCFRYFEGRGNRLWGARTISSDPEWKYVNIRRYFAYLERSIDVGTQWAVFEPNGPRLWANVRRTVEDFLFNEWTGGALLGNAPADSYFVKCDRSTMTQNDLDNGRMVCLIGAAVLRPAEFVIFRVGQWTADRRS